MDLYDIMVKYKIQLPLEILVNICKILKPRIYTIASSNKRYPSSIHMTISIVRDILPNGEIRKGSTS